MGRWLGIIRCEMKLHSQSQTSPNGAAIEVWEKNIISSYSLLGMWLPIHARIKVNPR